MRAEAGLGQLTDPTIAGATDPGNTGVKLTQLEREHRELRRANEILKSAAAFFGAELDRRSSR